MDSIHETPLRHCRFLGPTYFEELFETFLGAFADYVMPFNLTETQFRNHIVLNAVDLSSTVGWFDDGRMVGFTMNGFGLWHGQQTVYDAGTGILPKYRRRGISKRMFDWMLPIFADRGHTQCLLEVITLNEQAIALYTKLGFEAKRTLSLLTCPGEVDLKTGDDDIKLRSIVEPDWPHLMTFWDGEPSWQNSPDAVDRSRDKKSFIGAYIDERLIGYIVFSENVGRIAQVAVDPAYRRRGVGSRLLAEMIGQMSEGHVPQVINIDRSVASAMQFFTNRGFVEKLSQYEMLRGI